MLFGDGDAIPNINIRVLITADQTGGRFSAMAGVLAPRSLVVPHTHAREDELGFVQRGRIGARVGDRDVVVDAGQFVFRPHGVVHALWNPTDEPAVTVEIISPGGLERFFQELGQRAVSGTLTREDMTELAARYDSPFHTELIPELVEAYGVQPGRPWREPSGPLP